MSALGGYGRRCTLERFFVAESPPQVDAITNGTIREKPASPKDYPVPQQRDPRIEETDVRLR